MEVGLYLPVYRRSFRGGYSIFSPWRLSRFVTKLFIYTCMLKITYFAAESSDFPDVYDDNGCYLFTDSEYEGHFVSILFHIKM